MPRPTGRPGRRATRNVIIRANAPESGKALPVQIHLSEQAPLFLSRVPEGVNRWMGSQNDLAGMNWAGATK